MSVKKNGNPNQPAQLKDESENSQKMKAASAIIWNCLDLLPLLLFLFFFFD